MGSARPCWRLPLKNTQSLLGTLALGLVAVLAGCGGSAEQSPARVFGKMGGALGDRARRLTTEGGGWLARGNGFARCASAGGLVATLQSEGESLAIDLGLERLEVESQCRRQATQVGRAITYACDGYIGVWVATETGAENWLVFPRGIDASHAVASWSVRGGLLKQHGRSVDILDVDGQPHITVSAPIGYDEAGKPIAARVVAHGDLVELQLDESVDGALLIDPAWVPAGTMAQGRTRHTATLLPTGKVLAAGGCDDNVVATATAELWDPTTRTWSTAAPMTDARCLHSATVLKDGRVLAAFGDSSTGVLSAEAYDPAADKWLAAGKIGEFHAYHGAVLLADGSVLVIGGDANFTSITERYDPAANSWSKVASPPPGWSTDVEGVLLPSGVVFAYGISNGNAGLYDPKTNLWVLTPPPATPRAAVPMSALGSGRLLFAGGDLGSNGVANTAEVYDPKLNSWSTVASMATPRSIHTSASLPDGTVIQVGGRMADFKYLTTTEIYDETTNTWSAGPPMADKRYNHAMANLGGGKLLAVGGGVNDDHTSEMMAPGKADGVACNANNQCASDYCVDGVCCDQKCAGDKQCEVCTKAKGAVSDGTCIKLNAAVCEDGNLCTLNDKCIAGKCTSGKALTCAALDQCHDIGSCDTKTGMCSNPNKTDGAACSDGDKCTQTDGCKAGKCLGANPVVCLAQGVCYDAGSCDSASGVCSASTKKTDGATCDDKNPCTLDDACSNGVCGSPKLVKCPAMDDCHSDGVCDTKTGDCQPIAKADGTKCDDKNPCNIEDHCSQGKCVDNGSKTCPPPTACHLAAACNSTTGDCSYDVAADGTSCPGGACKAGTCVPGGSGAGGASGSGSGVTAGTGSSATGGVDPSAGAGGEAEPPGASGGCACTVVPEERRDRAWLALAGLALFRLRRRRRGALRASASNDGAH